MPALEVSTGFTHMVAVQHTAEFHLLAIAMASVPINLIHPRYRLVIIIAARIKRQLPVTIRHTVVQRPVLRLAVVRPIHTPLSIRAIHLVIPTQRRPITQVQQVIQPQWMVYCNSHHPLVFARGLAATVI